MRDIQAISTQNDGSLTEADFRKITHFNAFAVPAVLGESFVMLSDKKLNLNEHLALTY